MAAQNPIPLKIKLLRWVARAWTVPVTLIAVLVLIPALTAPPDSMLGKDIFLLSLWGVAILGLLLAWRWERVGALITIGMLFVRELAWVILYGNWSVSFLIVWLGLVPPAILFLLSDWQRRKLSRMAASQPE